MKIITVTGYYGTGSSAVTDLISELDNVYSLGDREIRFLHDPNGISDLEFKIVENFNRHNSSYAIKHYLEFAKFLNSTCGYKKYAKIFNDKFLKHTYEYINDLILFKYKGSWHYDVIDKGIYFYVLDRVLNKIIGKINKLAKTKILKPYNCLSNKESIVYGVNPDEDNFLKATRRYINNLLEELPVGNNEILMIDQIVASSNIKRYLRYFSDPVYVFLVDRDPRDLYILDKLYWGNVGFPDNVKEFCEHYKLIRYTQKNEITNKQVCFIHFEDLIYNFEETKEKIFDFINVDETHHINKLKYFNPNISINNTQLWLKHTEYRKEIEYIEQYLQEYLYDYSGIGKHEFTKNIF